MKFPTYSEAKAAQRSEKNIRLITWKTNKGRQPLKVAGPVHTLNMVGKPLKTGLKMRAPDRNDHENRFWWVYYFMRFRRFLSNSSECLPLLRVIFNSPFLLTLGCTCSLEGQPYLALQDGAVSETAAANIQKKDDKRYFFINCFVKSCYLWATFQTFGWDSFLQTKIVPVWYFRCYLGDEKKK